MPRQHTEPQRADGGGVLVTLVVLAVVLAAATALAIGVAAADSADGPIGGVFADDADGSTDWTATLGNVVDGLDGVIAGTVERYVTAASEVVGLTDYPAAAESADRVQTFFNNHSAAFQAWVNNRTTATETVDVVAVTFARGDSAVTRYVVADVVDGDYTNASMVNATDRSVDETVRLEGAAAANARDELETFYESYVEPGEDIAWSDSFVTRITQQYRSDIDLSRELL